MVCNELWLSVCLRKLRTGWWLSPGQGLGDGQSQDNSHLILGVVCWAMEGGKTLQYMEYESSEVMSLLEIHIFPLSDSGISPTPAVGNGDLRISQCLPETSRYPGAFSLCK